MSNSVEHPIPYPDLDLLAHGCDLSADFNGNSHANLDTRSHIYVDFHEISEHHGHLHCDSNIYRHSHLNQHSYFHSHHDTDSDADHNADVHSHTDSDGGCRIDLRPA